MRRPQNPYDQIFYMPPMPRHYKKYLIIQGIFVILFIYIWYTLNGGFIPKFLIPKMPFLNIGPEIGCLVFFSVDSDASKINWARRANSLQTVKQAMKDERIHMIAGDVILQGQGTKSQSLKPIMAHLSLPSSDITLKDWLHEAQYGSKGIKIHIHTMESLEISLETLSDFHRKNPIKFPVWIHVDILQGPFGDKPAIDSNRFFQHLKRLFPKCTLSLGWTTGTHTDLTQAAYTWNMVWDMLEIVKKVDMEDQVIVFQARLSLIHNSVPQLKWLCDNVPQSGLMIWHEENDEVVQEDLMYVSYRFPPHAVYFDLNHERFATFLSRYRHFSKDKVDHYVLERDEVMFKPGAWLKMGFHDHMNSLLASTEAITLGERFTYIISKGKYSPTSEVFIQGRVQFMDRKKKPVDPFHSGLSIYVRPSDYSDFDNLVGIRCFLGADGEFEISGSNLPDTVPAFRKTARLTVTSANCFRFKIVNDKTKISFKVGALHDCTTLESVKQSELNAELIVNVPKQLFTTEQRPFILKVEDTNRQALIDELSIKHNV